MEEKSGMRTNTAQFVKEQYKDSANLDIRIALHQRYSTNSKDWHEWVFEKINFSNGCRIIEFGCGSGVLWRNNLDKIQSTWTLTLTDLSDGMLVKARDNVGHLRQVDFREMDIQQIDAADDSFDIVMANHMLYHVPNIQAALAEVKRILKPGGLFYAATNGQRHMGEIFDFVQAYDAELPLKKPRNAQAFGLENGAELLRPYFKEVHTLFYPSDLHVTRVHDLVDYISSIGGDLKEILQEKEKRHSLTDYLESKKNEQGYITIHKHTGLFVCRK